MAGVKVGIIGIGNMGFAHFQSIMDGKVPGMVVKAVCDLRKERLNLAKEKHPEVEVYDSYEALLKYSDTEAIIVAVPHPLHTKIAMAVLKSNRHVLVEKPVDIKISNAQKLNQVAKESGKQFGIMFNQRTNGLFAKARELVKSGELGALKRSVWIITNWYRTQCYYDSGSWRATWGGEGGGVLLNQAPHNLDLWQWICGMPCAVTAFCNEGKYHHIEVEDEATIYAEYENGATGVFITSTGDCPGTNRFEMTGTRGKIVLENGVLKFWKLKQDEREICENAKEGFISPETEYQEFTCEKEKAHVGILNNFANAILYGEELLAPGYDGIYELTISNAAYLSQWKGNQKISLPFDTEEFDSILAQKAEKSVQRTVVGTSKRDASCEKRWEVKW